MEDPTEWKILKMCSDRMGLIITSSVTYSRNEHFCSIVIDGLLVAAAKGVDLFDTINETAKKAIRKIEDYSQQQMEAEHLNETNLYLGQKCHRFFPLFEKYIVNFKQHVDHVTSASQTFASQNNLNNASATNWTRQTYNPGYIPTKNYTTSECLTVKVEPREIKVVTRKMLHERHNQIDQSNIGFRMLLGLGWDGGPLGPNQDGIAEPISVELRARRSGLGCDDRQSLQSTFGGFNHHILFQFLKQYADDERQYDVLEFSDDFSYKEKKKLNGISKDLNLLHESEHRNGMLVVRIMKPNYK